MGRAAMVLREWRRQRLSRFPRIVVENAAGLFHDWRHNSRPERRRLGKNVRHGCKNAAGAFSGLHEIPSRECASGDQIEHVGVDLRSRGLHEIEGQGITRFLVGMEYPEPGIEPAGEAGKPRFSLEQGIQVVQTTVGILTVKEAAELLRVSVTNVYELVLTRQLPAMHVGRQIRIGRRGLVAFLHGMNADDFDALIMRRADQEL